MKKTLEKRYAKLKNQAGFTLIEILIVVILLGILATILIPQISVSTQDAKLNAVKSNLSSLRSAVELYYYQHSSTYPGQNDITGSGTSNAATAGVAFLQQLTRYTATDGTVSDTKDTTHAYGPYVKGNNLPANSFNDLNTVLCDGTETDITARSSDGTTAWKFYTQTGVLMSNDGDHDTL